MPPQNENDAEKYKLSMPDSIQISPDDNTATFTFTVNRDEPYNDKNLIWMNWGVFDSPNDADIGKVHGSRDSQKYEISLTYSDYFDRVYINWTYITLAIVGSVYFWAALPL